MKKEIKHSFKDGWGKKMPQKPNTKLDVQNSNQISFVALQRNIFLPHCLCLVQSYLFLAHSNQQKLWDEGRGVDGLAGPACATMSATGFRVAFGLKLPVAE